MSTKPEQTLETFPNPEPGREYEIRFTCPELTVRITYAPDRKCVELKSLKLYLWSYRDEGHFHEAVTNRILNDLVAATRPRWMEVEGDFFMRGGIHTVIKARHDGQLQSPES